MNLWQFFSVYTGSGYDFNALSRWVIMPSENVGIFIWLSPISPTPPDPPFSSPSRFFSPKLLTIHPKRGIMKGGVFCSRPC